jgi:hypothetical protein
MRRVTKKVVAAITVAAVVSGLLSSTTYAVNFSCGIHSITCVGTVTRATSTASARTVTHGSAPGIGPGDAWVKVTGYFRPAPSAPEQSVSNTFGNSPDAYVSASAVGFTLTSAKGEHKGCGSGTVYSHA